MSHARPFQVAPEDLAARLRLRPGARFTCHADGLCCSDIHALGPILDHEVVPLRRLMSKPVEPDASAGGNAFRIDQRGACVFLRRDRLCEVHAQLGLEQKPAVCRRFPYHLVDTPDGLRVFTPHRCTCRSLGERAPLDAAVIVQEITVAKVPPAIEWRVSAPLALAPGRRVSFAQWQRLEDDLLAALAQRRDPLRVLAAPAFPPLRKTTWADVGETFLDRDDGSAFEHAKAWVGQAILHLCDDEPLEPASDARRPWLRFFPRIERRLGAVADSRALVCDWLADELWSLGWTRTGNFAQGAADLATRVLILRALARNFARAGTRTDLAMAEAILIMDVVAHSAHWDEVARAIARLPGTRVLSQPTRAHEMRAGVRPTRSPAPRAAAARNAAGKPR